MTVTIDVDFGSDFQAAPAMRVLEQALEAWASDVRERHKENRVTWTVAEKPSEPSAPRR